MFVEVWFLAVENQTSTRNQTKMDFATCGFNESILLRSDLAGAKSDHDDFRVIHSRGRGVPKTCCLGDDGFMMGDRNSKKRAEEHALIHKVVSKTRRAVLTGPAGARFLGLETLTWVTQVDLVYPSKSRARCSQSSQADGPRIYRNGDLPDSNWQVKDGVRVASLIRCIFDTFRYYGALEALVQIESARWQWRGLTVDELLKRAETLPRAKGIRSFCDLIRHSADTSMSPLETIKRHTILSAIADGRLTGVETIEFQVGFHVTDIDGSPTLAWADALINGHIAVEADGLEKTDGTYGDPATAIRGERHRETEMQNSGARVIRTKWADPANRLIDQIQQQINFAPGVRQLPNRSKETIREFLDRIERRAAG